MLFFTLQFLTIICYSILAGQSFFYAMGAGSATRRLSATAFIEQRNSLDAVIASRLKVLYLVTAASLLVLLYMSCTNDMVFLTNIVMALICLLADMFIAARKNVPLNKLISEWRVDSYPSNWEEVRNEWLRYYNWRMVACITGFLYLLGGLFALAAGL